MEKNAVQIYALFESMKQIVSIHSMLSHRRRCTGVLITLAFYVVNAMLHLSSEEVFGSDGKPFKRALFEYVCMNSKFRMHYSNSSAYTPNWNLLELYGRWMATHYLEYILFEAGWN